METSAKLSTSTFLFLSFLLSRTVNAHPLPLPPSLLRPAQMVLTKLLVHEEVATATGISLAVASLRFVSHRELRVSQFPHPPTHP